MTDYITSSEFERSFKILCKDVNANTEQNKDIVKTQIKQTHQIKSIQSSQDNYKVIAIGLLFSVLSLAGVGAYSVLTPNQAVTIESKPTPVLVSINDNEV